MKWYRTSKTFKVLTVYLILCLIFPQGIIHNASALTGGPSQPEFNSFTPIATSDMVNLNSGDFNYNIPIMDVGGYPLNLAYNSGITMDQEASWVGLGWNLNVGQIKRNVRGLPDDFDGDQMTYENNFKTNWTVGAHFGVDLSFFGFKEVLGLSGEAGLGVQYNNYNGFTSSPTVAASFKVPNTPLEIGLGVTGSTVDGPTVSPTITLSNKIKNKVNGAIRSQIGLSINSRKALSTFSLSIGASGKGLNGEKFSGTGLSGSVSFNNDPLFTPTKKVSTLSNDISYSGSIGGIVIGARGQVKVTGNASIQRINPNDKNKKVRAFGYEYTENNRGTDFRGVLDFNREKERAFSKNTTILGTTNYTYDSYAINGQGIQGQFRPYRGQVGFLYSPRVDDSGLGGSLGFESEVGWNFGKGIDFKMSPSHSRIGLWKKRNKNYAIDNFKESQNNRIDYEKVYFRNSAELNVDVENEKNGLYEKTLDGEKPLSLRIVGGKYNRSLVGKFNTKKLYKNVINISGKLKRKNRLLRKQSIQKITVEDAKKFKDPFFKLNNLAKLKHTAGFNVLEPNGSRYVYGQAVYNRVKRETTFAVKGNGNCKTGLVEYNPDSSLDPDKTKDLDNTAENSTKNDGGFDHFFNRITTPAYAHSYLLTSVLSSDYEDKTGDGPTDDDFGAYTKFNYDTIYNYKWRVPYRENMASFDRGLYSHPDDQKGHYIYGEREQVYLKSIQTKTHIAIFKLSPRKDGFGVKGENGGRHSTATTLKIDNIKLYSKKEYRDNPASAVPIKTAHFVYDYSLCKGIPNNNNSTSYTSNELLNQGGKLTLKKVYFTYEKSNMGAYMPYEFNYGQLDVDNDGVFDKTVNPAYHIKGYDIWGNYKENENGNCDVNAVVPTNSEFPYTDQSSQEKANENTVAWTLTSLELPSGGDMKIHYESDDYAYVQDKGVMQLYSIAGVGSKHLGSTSTTQELNNSTLYNSNFDNKFLYVKVPAPNNGISLEKHKENFIEGLKGEPVYFKFLLNMTRNQEQYDYVSGYLFFDKNIDVQLIKRSNDYYLSIPMEFVRLDGKDDDQLINPISKAGMFFGRKNMNRIVYNRGGNYKVNADIGSIISEIVGSIGSMLEIGKGPNLTLRNKKCANNFKPSKSWVRLNNPVKKKFGGGIRVKKLQMGDNWDIMTENTDNSSLYKKFYGQTYSYKDETGNTSGVATFEPNGSRENPLVQPIYGKTTYGNEAVLAPKESNYVEKPLGESFYPSATITYGRVTVENLRYQNVNKHATGRVVSEFYTSKDFPTKTDYTELDKHNMFYDRSGFISNFLNYSVKNHLTASQGVSIQRNDMNGKQKAQWVYAEKQDSPISGMEYKYDLDSTGELNNRVSTINHKGEIEQNLIGLNYDVVNDFNESYSFAASMGVNMNLSAFILAIFPAFVPVPIPTYQQHENVLRTSVTTKVIEKKGLLKEKIAYDLGAKVSTKNLAWDAQTGQVLVTETINEFDDNYYTLNYPAYWRYKRMGSASTNINMVGSLIPSTGNSYKLNNGALNTYLTEGDELNVTYGVRSEQDASKTNFVNLKLWIVKKEGANMTLMDKNGKIFNDCDDITTTTPLSFKVIRSGYRNVQEASMASITTKVNPVVTANGTYRARIPSFVDINPSNTKIINASAVEYSDYWAPINEERNKYFVEYGNLFVGASEAEEVNSTKLLSVLDKYDVNPYIYNVKGDWRAKKSWAYLTSRYQSNNPNLKEDGYFTSFQPFYEYKNDQWQIASNAVASSSNTKWTFASSVTKYAPFGVELENKDALNRYSSAQYGYKYTLPTAVASNSRYKEIGFDGFEDYQDTKESPRNAHFSFNDAKENKGYSLVTDKEAHSGRKSIEVKSNTKVSLVKNLLDTNPEEIEDCEVVVPVKAVNIRKIINQCSISVVFTLTGKPNTTVKYYYNNTGSRNPQSSWIEQTATLNSLGEAIVVLGDGASAEYICGEDRPDINDRTDAGRAQVIVRNENGDIIVNNQAADFTCGECRSSENNTPLPIFVVEKSSATACRREYTVMIHGGGSGHSVNYYVNNVLKTAVLDANGNYTKVHLTKYSPPKNCYNKNVPNENGSNKLLIEDAKRNKLLDVNFPISCEECQF